MNILNELKNLKEEYKDGEDRRILNEMQEEVIKRLTIKTVEEKEGIILIRDQHKKEIESIDNLLLTKRDITLEERDLLFARRDWWGEYLKIFETSIQEIEDRVKMEL